MNLATAAEPLPDPTRGKNATFSLGEDGDPNAPYIIYLQQPAGVTSSPHSHVSDYCEIVLEGSVKVGKKWHRKGDVRIVPAGSGYGPLEAGPDGLTALIIFARQDHGKIAKGAKSD
jgi:hypothetical protein